MGWEDRPYYRDRNGGAYSGPLRLLTGSVPFFTAFGVRVRVHASLIIFIISVILLDHFDGGPSIEVRAIAMGFLLGIVILHEYGHCFAARWVGGSAEDVLLSPIGGLAFTSPPHRPMANFITVVCGPSVNLVICIIAATAVYFLTPTPTSQWLGYSGHLLPPLNPFNWKFPLRSNEPAYYFLWVYMLSYGMLLFNLLPIFPLDGGQMLQSALWPSLGYHRSMMFSTMTGLIGSVVLAIFGIFTGMWWMAIIAACLFLYCYQKRQQLKESAPEPWADTSTIDYAASIYGKPEKPRRRRVNRRAINRARKIAHQEAVERERIDSILAKVSAHGMHSLTWGERRALRKATERQRKRDLELSKLF